MLRRITKIAGFLLACLFGLGLLAAMLGPQGGGWKAIRILSFGWLDFLQRTLPDVTVNWSAIGMVVLCSLVIVVCTQWFFRWLHKAIVQENSQPWRWRWTLALFASLWLTFGIVIGASGAVRHIKWLVESDEPIYRQGINPSDFRFAAMELNGLLQGVEWEPARLQTYLMSRSRRGGPLGAWDKYHYIILTAGSKHVASVVILPRDPEMQRSFGFVVSSEPGERISIDQLPRYLVSN